MVTENRSLLHFCLGQGYKYKCSPGFWIKSLEDNPDQELYCQGSRKVDFSGITEDCVRKFFFYFNLAFLNFGYHEIHIYSRFTKKQQFKDPL